MIQLQQMRRIIPALAGNTLEAVTCEPMDTDHPRAGGEHEDGIDYTGTDCGSSPRWRGTPEEDSADAMLNRIIPALAGNTHRLLGAKY